MGIVNGKAMALSAANGMIRAWGDVKKLFRVVTPTDERRRVSIFQKKTMAQEIR